MRDVLTHLDEYVLDKGRLQGKGRVEPGSSTWRAMTRDGDVVLVFGPCHVHLLAMAAAAPSEVMFDRTILERFGHRSASLRAL